MSIIVIRGMLKHCPDLEQLQWDLNTESWFDIFVGNEQNSLFPSLGGSKLKALQLVNRDYHYQLPERFLDQVLAMPLRCFWPLTKLEKLRIDLEGLTRVTAAVLCLPKSLKELEVVVPCDVDYHRHWYQPNKDEYEIRKGNNFFDWGEPRDTWLSLCFVKLDRMASSGRLPELRSLVVNH
ncbi:hypothetical protein PG994_011966 [Apiospora phragmitis]|uniref:Uncharacterized protein n=1 Tax=Apiospora phragmitis TaxID=2905665 RepID=A0ABR1TUC2_9PEZI